MESNLVQISAEESQLDSNPTRNVSLQDDDQSDDLSQEELDKVEDTSEHDIISSYQFNGMPKIATSLIKRVSKNDKKNPEMKKKED